VTFKQQKEWLATNLDGKLPTNQKIEGYDEEERKKKVFLDVSKNSVSIFVG